LSAIIPLLLRPAAAFWGEFPLQQFLKSGNRLLLAQRASGMSVAANPGRFSFGGSGA
jgi:hypothetical protein